MEFRQQRRVDYVEEFKQLAQGQKPDALFIACSDSRMAVNVFASTNPGDLFVIRNVGNMVPPHDDPHATGTAAAVEFAVNTLAVSNIIVCGHSGCGAMQAHCRGHQHLEPGHLKTWLDMAATEDPRGMDVDEASRQNVLGQLNHLRAYPGVKQAMDARGLALHGLWFNIGKLDVLYWEQDPGEWTLLDEEEGTRILGRLEK
jgi:carbonic anhydrase